MCRGWRRVRRNRERQEKCTESWERKGVEFGSRHEVTRERDGARRERDGVRRERDGVRKERWS